MKNPQLCSLLAGLAVTRTLKKIISKKITIKWPNDILIESKKICGILSELIIDKESYIVCGIGLNIYQKTFPENINGTSLVKETSQNVDKFSLLKNILLEFDRLCELFFYDPEKLINIWLKESNLIGQEIVIEEYNNKKFIIEGVNLDGYLIINDGTKNTLIISQEYSINRK